MFSSVNTPFSHSYIRLFVFEYFEIVLLWVECSMNVLYDLIFVYKLTRLQKFNAQHILDVVRIYSVLCLHDSIILNTVISYYLSTSVIQSTSKQHNLSQISWIISKYSLRSFDKKLCWHLSSVEQLKAEYVIRIE